MLRLAGLGKQLLLLMLALSILFGLIYFYIFFTINKEEAFRSGEIRSQLEMIVEGIRGELPPSLTQVLNERHLAETAPEDQMRFLDDYLSQTSDEIIKILIGVKAGFYFQDKDHFIGATTSAIPLRSLPGTVHNTERAAPVIAAEE